MAKSRNRQFILALDQGTTSSRAILFDRAAGVIASLSRPITQIYPRSGWVEHDPVEIWETQREVAKGVLEVAGVHPSQIAAIGITNQRETTVVWERGSGRPLHNAIVWQCRRSAPLCEELVEQGFDRVIREKTGLLCDAYFSATKVRWLLDNVPGLRRRAEQGEALFGTVDTWLLYNLTGGRVHATDLSNASRTMLFDIHEGCWSPEILSQLGIAEAMLPKVCPSSHPFGITAPDILAGARVPVTGIAGDQQAALFGQACFGQGMAKVTFGTGSFLLMNTGKRAIPAPKGLITSIAWGLGGEVTYCVEGSVFIAGAVIQWLRDELGILSSAQESESLAESVPDNGGVYLVPAFVGLGAPHWDMRARGAIVGLTRGASRAHIVRAALESMAYQSRDVLECAQDEAGISLRELRADGGAASNGWMMQFVSDMLGVPVRVPSTLETTALGGAFLAGLKVGFWRDLEELASLWKQKLHFLPRMDPHEREGLYRNWRRAVDRARNWAED